jgi:hypothetical protein
MQEYQAMESPASHTPGQSQHHQWAGLDFGIEAPGTIESRAHRPGGGHGSPGIPAIDPGLPGLSAWDIKGYNKICL